MRCGGSLEKGKKQIRDKPMQETNYQQTSLSGYLGRMMVVAAKISGGCNFRAACILAISHRGLTNADRGGSCWPIEHGRWKYEE